MTEQERQEIKARLIESGFWGADDEGDPTVDGLAAEMLLERVGNRLAKDVNLLMYGLSANSPVCEYRVRRGEFEYPLDSETSRPLAICKAALELPEFLKQHPECAADQK